MTRNGERTCRLLALILLLYVALAAWYSLTIPLGEAPDEVPHFTYVRYLTGHGRLPTTTEEHEAFQPPLYYVLGAVLTAPIQDEAASPFAVQANAHFDVSDPRSPKNLLLHSAVEDWPYRGWVLAWHLVRLLSIALGAVTVWATFHLGRAILPDQPLIALTMAALTAFTPQFLFMSAVVNNDNAATAFSALILWRMAVLLRSQTRPQIWRHSALLGLLLGLGLLSKASVGALLPVVPPASGPGSPPVRTGAGCLPVPCCWRWAWQPLSPAGISGAIGCCTGIRWGRRSCCRSTPAARAP